MEWFAIGDLNGAGKPDILTVNDLPDDEQSDDDGGDEKSTVTGTVTSFINHGDGTFTGRGSYELVQDWNDFALEDLNHDAALDLVSAANDDTSVSVLLNTGTGGFRAGSDYKIGAIPQAVAIHDVNGDGKPDLVTTNDYGEDDDDETTTVSVLLNRGDGSFRDSHDYVTGDVAGSLVIGDLNGDRRADIVTVDAYEGVLSVLLNNGDASFAKRHDYPTGDAVALIAISDLNGDGHPELVTVPAEGDTDSVSVFINDGDGGFPSRHDVETGSGPRDLAIGDLNGDGRRDLVVADSGQLAVSVLMNTMGDGEPFVAPSPLFPHAHDYATGYGTLSVAVGDLNGDGRQDLVSTSRIDGTVSVLLGRKNGFAEGAKYEVGLVPRWVAIGDLDRDGAPDLAVANTHDDTASILINRGDGTFKKKRDYPTGHRPYTVAIGDLDGDGSLDLAVGDAGPIGGLTVSVLLNDGKGAFGERHAYRTARAPLSVAIGDLNGDGKADIVTANHLRRSVSVLLNAGNGTFAGRRDYRVGRFPRSVAIGDLNGDGAPDLAVANTRDDGVSVLLNAGDGSFGVKHDFATGTSPAARFSLSDGIPRPLAILVLRNR